MPAAESATEQQQSRDNIRRVLARAGIPIGDERLDSLARAVDSARIAGEAIASAVAGDQPPAVFRAPDARADA